MPGYNDKNRMSAGPVMRDKPQTGGPMPRFEMPGSQASNKQAADKNMLRKKAIQKRFMQG